MDDRPPPTRRRGPGAPANGRRERRARPLDPARLDELALAYVARFATSAGKLSDYLARKLRERGWEGDVAPDPAEVVERMVRAGYVDDAAYARAKGAGLLRRGYGERRVEQALRAAGIDEDLRHDLRASEGERRRAALALARKRGFGPFGRDLPDRALRQKQIAAMLRAGHPLEAARELVDAANIEAAMGWADEADGD